MIDTLTFFVYCAVVVALYALLMRVGFSRFKINPHDDKSYNTQIHRYNPQLGRYEKAE